jgi:hypothetical protein
MEMSPKNKDRRVHKPFDLDSLINDAENLTASLFCSLAFTNLDDNDGPLYKFLISKGVSAEIAVVAQSFFAERNAMVLARKKMNRTFAALDRIDSKVGSYLESQEKETDDLIDLMRDATSVLNKITTRSERIKDTFFPELDDDDY